MYVQQAPGEKKKAYFSILRFIVFICHYKLKYFYNLEQYVNKSNKQKGLMGGGGEGGLVENH